MALDILFDFVSVHRPWVKHLQFMALSLDLGSPIVCVQVPDLCSAVVVAIFLEQRVRPPGLSCCRLSILCLVSLEQAAPGRLAPQSSFTHHRFCFGFHSTGSQGATRFLLRFAFSCSSSQRSSRFSPGSALYCRWPELFFLLECIGVLLSLVLRFIQFCVVSPQASFPCSADVRSAWVWRLGVFCHGLGCLQRRFNSPLLEPCFHGWP
jgi:hypothetical protein